MFKTYFLAARPQTLPAAIVPVCIGSALAWHNLVFQWDVFIVALVCASLIQIGTNFANDYFDFKSGADNATRIGFQRATSSGLISPEHMLRATLWSMGLAFVIGLYLVYVGGWPIFIIGIASLLCGIAYTGGPFPLGYNGLGDVFVFLFFGIIAVMGTYFAHSLSWNMHAFWASLIPAALATNILVVNNLRDVETDAPAGKRTLAVLFGEHLVKVEYLIMLMLALAIPPHFLVREGFPFTVLLPLVLTPFGLWLVWQVWRTKEKSHLNKTLERTAQFMALYGLLFSLGLLL